MNQTFYTPINEPYQQHYNYYLPSTINGQKSKKGTTCSPNTNNNNNNSNNTVIPSFVKTTSTLLDHHDHQQQQNINTATSQYLYNNGSYNEAPSPSVHQQDNILPPLSSLLPPPVDIHSTTKYSSNTNYPHTLNNNNMNMFAPPNISSPFNSSRPHDIYQPLSSPVSNASRSTTESLSRRNSVSSSATSSLDTPDNQKRIFQNMISRVMTKEDKKVVKINQQQQTSLLMKVLKFNQLKLAQMIAQSNRTHHTISAQLLDNGRKLDVYVLARKKNLGVNSFANMDRRVDCFKLEDYSFNIVVLEPNH